MSEQTPVVHKFNQTIEAHKKEFLRYKNELESLSRKYQRIQKDIEGVLTSAKVSKAHIEKMSAENSESLEKIAARMWEVAGKMNEASSRLKYAIKRWKLQGQTHADPELLEEPKKSKGFRPFAQLKEAMA